MEAIEVFQGVAKTSLGYKLVCTMGWAEGDGLGANKQGITSHVRTRRKLDASGVGADTARARAHDWTIGMVQYSSVLEGLSEVTSRHAAKTRLGDPAAVTEATHREKRKRRKASERRASCQPAAAAADQAGTVAPTPGSSGVGGVGGGSHQPVADDKSLRKKKKLLKRTCGSAESLQDGVSAAVAAESAAQPVNDAMKKKKKKKRSERDAANASQVSGRKNVPSPTENLGDCATATVQAWTKTKQPLQNATASSSDHQAGVHGRASVSEPGMERVASAAPGVRVARYGRQMRGKRVAGYSNDDLAAILGHSGAFAGGNNAGAVHNGSYPSAAADAAADPDKHSPAVRLQQEKLERKASRKASKAAKRGTAEHDGCQGSGAAAKADGGDGAPRSRSGGVVGGGSEAKGHAGTWWGTLFHRVGALPGSNSCTISSPPTTTGAAGGFSEADQAEAYALAAAGKNTGKKGLGKVRKGALGGDWTGSKVRL